MPNKQKRRKNNITQIVLSVLLTLLSGLIIEMEPVQAVVLFIVIMIFHRIESIHHRVPFR